MYYKFESADQDALFFYEWVFMVVLDHEQIRIVLSTYHIRHRQSKRHKVTVFKFYDRLNLRDCTIKDEPVVPEEVSKQVLAEVRDRVVLMVGGLNGTERRS